MGIIALVIVVAITLFIVFRNKAIEQQTGTSSRNQLGRKYSKQEWAALSPFERRQVHRARQGLPAANTNTHRQLNRVPTDGTENITAATATVFIIIAATLITFAVN